MSKRKIGKREKKEAIIYYKAHIEQLLKNIEKAQALLVQDRKLLLHSRIELAKYED